VLILLIRVRCDVFQYLKRPRKLPKKLSQYSAVYLIVRLCEYPTILDIFLLLKRVEYVGTTDLADLMLRFITHCAQKGKNSKIRNFSKDTHGIIKFSEWNSDSVDVGQGAKFASPGLAALAYELALDQFAGFFSSKFGYCMPGTSSTEVNHRLFEKLDNDEDKKQIWHTLINVLKGWDLVKEKEEVCIFTWEI
jgi:hypothetical protein